MGYSKAQKEKTYKRIIAIASKRFREQGLAGECEQLSLIDFKTVWLLGFSRSHPFVETVRRNQASAGFQTISERASTPPSQPSH